MHPQLSAIINSKLPTRRVINLRRQPRKTWAKEVRKLFKEMNLTGISVTTPSYSMASTIDISLPAVTDCTYETLTTEQKYHCDGHLQFCPACKERWNAHEKIKEILAEAFPDLDDRSEYISDYFDNCFSIN